jgi:hypothetical protein
MEVSFSWQSFPNYVYFIPKLNINYLTSAFFFAAEPLIISEHTTRGHAAGPATVAEEERQVL